MSQVHLSIHEGIATLRMDDGKANALSLAHFAAMNAALDEAAAARAPVVLTGRPGLFSAGFDLRQMMSGDAVACDLLRAGAEFCLRILTYPRPIVAACTGHAFPMGAFLLLSSDHRIGAAGAFKIGMNEAEIGIVPPSFALELARSQLTPAAYNRTVLTGAMFTPSEACAAGFLDEVCAAEHLADAADAKVSQLAALPAGAHHQIKRRLRAPLVAAIRAAIDGELTVASLRAVRAAAAAG